MIWILFILITTSVASASASAKDTIFPNQTLKDGDTLVSAGQVFELGFFGLRNPNLRYLGIRYNNIPRADVVWLANRDAPLFDDKGMLILNGTLQLLNVGNNVIWSSETVRNTSRRSSNLVAQLLDSGNLVLKDDTSGELVWQSFDHPGNTLLPGMKIGLDGVTGQVTNLTSWKTSDDPSTASYILAVEIADIGYPQLWITEGKSLKQNVGFWNGLGFTGMTPGTMTHPEPSNFCTFDLVLTDKDTYFRYRLVNDSVLTRMKLDDNGGLRLLVWMNQTQSWGVYMTSFTYPCDTFGLCGPFGSCNVVNTAAAEPCACLQGFEQTLREEWLANDWSSGCKPCLLRNVGMSAVMAIVRLTQMLI